MTIKAGGIIDASDLLAPFCQATQATAQSLVTATSTAISFDSEAVDTLAIHDTVTLNSRFVIGKKLGWWLVSAAITYNSNATGDRRSRVMLNGTAVVGGWTIIPAAAATFHTATTPGILVQATAATDYVEIHGQQSSGANLSTIVSGDFRSRVSLTYVGLS